MLAQFNPSRLGGNITPALCLVAGGCFLDIQGWGG